MLFFRSQQHCSLGPVMLIAAAGLTRMLLALTALLLLWKAIIWSSMLP
ncbi:hypothetical protein [Candidatus Palibaumannia cicadellinicola]|nr:hypothetical protein [Candidatus Baumannia cicadellinicola]